MCIDTDLVLMQRIRHSAAHGIYSVTITTTTLQMRMSHCNIVKAVSASPCVQYDACSHIAKLLQMVDGFPEQQLVQRYIIQTCSPDQRQE